jgi:hypothetical protein
VEVDLFRVGEGNRPAVIADQLYASSRRGAGPSPPSWRPASRVDGHSRVQRPGPPVPVDQPDRGPGAVLHSSVRRGPRLPLSARRDRLAQRYSSSSTASVVGTFAETLPFVRPRPGVGGRNTRVPAASACFGVGDRPTGLPPAVEGSVYLFISEPMTNVVKHAQADEAMVCFAQRRGAPWPSRFRTTAWEGRRPGGGSDLNGLGDRNLRPRWRSSSAARRARVVAARRGSP